MLGGQEAETGKGAAQTSLMTSSAANLAKGHSQKSALNLELCNVDNYSSYFMNYLQYLLVDMMMNMGHILSRDEFECTIWTKTHTYHLVQDTFGMS